MMATESSADPEFNPDIPENLNYVDHKEYKINSPDRECFSASMISVRTEVSSSQTSAADIETSMSLQEAVVSNATFDTNSNFIVSSHSEHDEYESKGLTDQAELSDINNSLERSVDRIETKYLIDETDKIVSPVKLVEDMFRFVGDQELEDGEGHQQANDIFDFSGRTAPLARLETDEDLDITESAQYKLEKAPVSENMDRNRDPDDLNNNLTMPQQKTVMDRSSEDSSVPLCTATEIGNNELRDGHVDKQNVGDLHEGHIVEVKQQSEEDEKTGEVVVITETITEEVEKETVHVTEIEEVWEYVEDSSHGMVIRKKNVVSQKEADEVNLKTLRKSHITTERHRKYIDDEPNLTSEVLVPDQAEIEVLEKLSVIASDAESQENIREEPKNKNQRNEEQEIAELSNYQAELTVQEKSYRTAPDEESLGTKEFKNKELSCEEQENTDVTVGLSQKKDTILIDSQQIRATCDPQGSNFHNEETQQLLCSEPASEENVSEIGVVGAGPINCDLDMTSEVSVPDKDQSLILEEPSISVLEKESQRIMKVRESEQKQDVQEFAELSDKKTEILQANMTLLDNQKSPPTYESHDIQIMQAQQLLLSTEHVKEEIVNEIITVEARLTSEIVTDIKDDTLTAEHKVLGGETISDEGNQVSTEDSKSIINQQISTEHNIPASQDIKFEQNQSVQLHHNSPLASSNISSQNPSEQEQVISNDGQHKKDNIKVEGVVKCEMDRSKEMKFERKFKAPTDCETKVVELGGSLMEEKSYEDIYFDDMHYSLTLHGLWLRQRNGKWQFKTDVAQVLCEEDSNEREIVEYLTKHYNCVDKDFKEPVSSFIHDLGLTEFSNFFTIQKQFRLPDCTVSLELTDFGFQVGEIAVKLASPAEIPTALQIIDNVANILGFQPLHIETI